MISCRDWWPWTKPGYVTNDPETKQQSVEWRHSGSPPPKKFRVQKSGGKVLASIFWDQDGILLVDYLPNGQTINVEYYSSLLVQLKDILKEKCRGKVTKGVLFLHDNAPAHWALATQKKQAYLGFQCLDHPPNSQDLAPSDYHLFPGLKKTIERSPSVRGSQFVERRRTTHLSCHTTAVTSSCCIFLDSHRFNFKTVCFLNSVGHFFSIRPCSATAVRFLFQ